MPRYFNLPILTGVVVAKVLQPGDTYNLQRTAVEARMKKHVLMSLR